MTTSGYDCVKSHVLRCWRNAVNVKVEGRRARGRQRLKFLDSLSTWWQEKWARRPTPIDHQGCRGQIALTSNGRSYHNGKAKRENITDLHFTFHSFDGWWTAVSFWLW